LTARTRRLQETDRFEERGDVVLVWLAFGRCFHEGGEKGGGTKMMDELENRVAPNSFLISAPVGSHYFLTRPSVNPLNLFCMRETVEKSYSNYQTMHALLSSSSSTTS